VTNRPFHFFHESFVAQKPLRHHRVQVFAMAGW
jgi:hypothetical protein